MANQFLVAGIQMVSIDDVDTNINNAIKLINDASSQGAQLIVLPEYFCMLSPRAEAKLEIAEDDGHGPIQMALRRAALDQGVWLIGGTIPIKSNQTGRVFNTQYVFSPQGDVVARYDKIHLFNFSNDVESYDEAATVAAGTQPVVVDIGLGRIGLSTCYDLRFPELYRALGAVDLIVVPSAFTQTTGRAHWEPLLRARAIENQTYVLAAAQGGEHPGARHTWGHSMLVDPWGEIIEQMQFGEGVILGEISGQRLESVRASLPALKHRVIGKDL
jgi:predicted amidohydrolase